MQVGYLVMVLKFMIMSAMKRPITPNTPPLAPTTAMQVLSNAALKRFPAAASGMVACGC